MEYVSEYAYRDACAYMYWANKTLYLKLKEEGISEYRARAIRGAIAKIEEACKSIEEFV